MHETYLMHHGIKGQKKGVRRYQNPDGTYTDEGLKRRRMNGDTDTDFRTARRNLDDVLSRLNMDYSHKESNVDAYKKRLDDAIKNAEKINPDKNNQNNQSNKKESNNQDLQKNTEKLEKEVRERQQRWESNADSARRNVGKLTEGIINIVNQKKRSKKVDAFYEEVSKMSDDELQRRLTRINRENNYRKALSEKASARGKTTFKDYMDLFNVAIDTVHDFRRAFRDW